MKVIPINDEVTMQSSRQYVWFYPLLYKTDHFKRKYTLHKAGFESLVQRN
ncbi:hypothetical protein Hanom_Chr07g00596671 [Helianthus anomalus]